MVTTEPASVASTAVNCGDSGGMSMLPIDMLFGPPWIFAVMRIVPATVPDSSVCAGDMTRAVVFAGILKLAIFVPFENSGMGSPLTTLATAGFGVNDRV